MTKKNHKPAVQNQKKNISQQKTKPVSSFIGPYAHSHSIFDVPSFFNAPSLFNFPSIGDISHRWFSEKSGLTVSEDAKNVYVEASLPGLTANDIEVTIDRGVLWVKGEKKEEKADKDKKYYFKSANSYSYNVTLPQQVDETKQPVASYKDGVMKITFVKKHISQAKKILVKNS